MASEEEPARRVECANSPINASIGTTETSRAESSRIALWTFSRAARHIDSGSVRSATMGDNKAARQDGRTEAANDTAATAAVEYRNGPASGWSNSKIRLR